MNEEEKTNEVLSQNQNIENLFVQLLAHEGGAECVQYYLNGWIYPSDSPTEKIYNETLTKFCEGLRQTLKEGQEGRVKPFDVILFLHKSRPQTQKTRWFQDYYLTAKESWYQTLAEAMKSLSWDEAQVFNPELVRVWKYSQVSDKATINLRWNSGYILSLSREVKEDKWGLTFHDAHTNSKYEHRLWVRLGHLSEKKMALSAQIDKIGDMTRIAVLVSHIGIPETHEYCNLPAACTIYVQASGVTFTPWRLRTDADQALLPAVGEKVRQGDAVLEACPRLYTYYQHVYSRDEWHLPSTIPEPTEQGIEFTDFYFKVPVSLKEVTLKHPRDDHPPITVTIPEDIPEEEDFWYIIVKKVRGYTQPRPGEGRFD